MCPSPKLCARGKDSYFCRHFRNGSFQNSSRRDQKDSYLSGISKGRLQGAGAPALRDGVSSTLPFAFEEW